MKSKRYLFLTEQLTWRKDELDVVDATAFLEKRVNALPDYRLKSFTVKVDPAEPGYQGTIYAFAIMEKEE